MTGFDANQVEPMGSREIITAGNYLAIITGALKKQTKAKTGHYLAVEFTILTEGQFKGRKLWNNLNLDNPNQTAVNIARAELSSICRATGVMTLVDEWDLSAMQSRPLTLTVGVNKDGYNGEPENTIRNYDVASQAGGFTAPPMEGTPVDKDDGLPF